MRRRRLGAGGGAEGQYGCEEVQLQDIRLRQTAGPDAAPSQELDLKHKSTSHEGAKALAEGLKVKTAPHIQNLHIQ